MQENRKWISRKKSLKKSKYWIFILFTVIIATILASFMIIHAQDTGTIVLKIGDPYMVINGEERVEVDKGRDTKPLIINNRTLVPLRTIVETVGGIVKWDDNTKTAYFSKNGCEISMSLMNTTKTLEKIYLNFNNEPKFDYVYEGSNFINVNSNPYQNDVAPIIYDDRIYMPLRFVAENLACKVEWNDAEKTVTIYYSKEGSKALDMMAYAYDLSPQSCGKSPGDPGYGYTALGTRATPGRTVAVDPNVIQLGTRLKINFPNDFSYMTGNSYVAEDIGGGVNGNKIDVFMGEDPPGCYDVYYKCLQFGTRHVKVEVIGN